MISNAITSPCKDCRERKPNCHASCEKYEQYKLDIQQIRDEGKGAEMADGYVYRQGRSYHIWLNKRRTR